MSSLVTAEGQRRDVVGAQSLSVWLPSDWEVDKEQQMFELVAFGPPEQLYRPNISIHHVSVDAALSLEAIADSTDRKQVEMLDTFVEYERRPSSLAGSAAVHREYGWVHAGTGLVLYQVEVLALPETAPGHLLEVHATSFAPSYFRYSALFRRMVDSIQPEPTT